MTSERGEFEHRRVRRADAAFDALMQRAAERAKARDEDIPEPPPLWIVIDDDGPEAA